MWFEALTGFLEESGDQVRANFAVEGEKLASTVNGRSMCYGRLETPTLAELRSRVAAEKTPTGGLQLGDIVADV